MRWLAALVALPAMAIEPDAAAKIFAEARGLCERDGGKLWGVTLCGPVVLADAQSRAVVANQNDKEGHLSEAAPGVWTGKLPDSVGIANTAAEWAGVRWTMLAWPLPREAAARARLLAHEMWHRVQGDLGLPARSPTNAHLDTVDGRLWLQLEMGALRKALASQAEARVAALSDARLFREQRKGGREEDLLELNEGLAEYTGVMVGIPEGTARREYADMQLRATRPSYVRSFAYATGPALGLLLDDLAPGWRSKVREAGSLWAMIPVEARRGDARAAAAPYGYEELRAAEQKRAEALEGLRRRFRDLLANGPALTLPNAKDLNVSFNPNNLVPLDEAGTIYPTMSARDVWGVLEVTGGALLDKGWRWIKVPAPKAGSLVGDGWTLKLNGGWKVAPQGDGGSVVLSEQR